MFVPGISSDFFLAFYLVYLQTFFVIYIYIYICVPYFWHSIWHVYLEHLLTFFLAFYLQSFFVVEVRLGSLSSSACSWGPAEEKEASWHKISHPSPDRWGKKRGWIHHQGHFFAEKLVTATKANITPAIGKKRDGCTLGCFRVEPMGLAVEPWVNNNLHLVDLLSKELGNSQALIEIMAKLGYNYVD